MAATATMNLDRAAWKEDLDRKHDDDSDDDDDFLDLLTQPVTVKRPRRQPKSTVDDTLNDLFSESTNQHSSLMRLQQSFANSATTPNPSALDSRQMSFRDDSALKETIDQLTQSLVTAEATPSATSPQERFLLKRALEDEACVPYGIIDHSTVPITVRKVYEEDPALLFFYSSSEALEYFQKYIIVEEEEKNVLEDSSPCIGLLRRIHRFFATAVVVAIECGTLWSLQDSWLGILRDGNAILEATQKDGSIDNCTPLLYTLQRRFYQWLTYVAVSADLEDALEEPSRGASKKRLRRMPLLYSLSSDATQFLLAVQEYHRCNQIPLPYGTRSAVSSITLDAFGELLLQYWFRDYESSFQAKIRNIGETSLFEQKRNIRGFANFLSIHENVLAEVEDHDAPNDVVYKALQVLVRCTIHTDMQRVQTVVQRFLLRYTDRIIGLNDPICQGVLDHMISSACIALQGILEIESLNSAVPTWFPVSAAARAAIPMVIDSGRYPTYWRAAFSMKGMEVLLQLPEKNESIVSYVRASLEEETAEWTALYSSSSFCWLSLGAAFVALRQWNQMRQTSQSLDFAKNLAILECITLLFQTGMLLLKEDDTATKKMQASPLRQHRSRTATEFGSFLNARAFLSYLTEFDDLCMQGSNRSSVMLDPLCLRADMLLKYVHLDNLKMKQRLLYIVGDDEFVTEMRQTRISNFFAGDPDPE
jgi:hypothetical protein